MKKVLGRKQSMDNTRWLDAIADIENLVSREEVSEAVSAVISEIKKTVKGKKAAYAWSGGKDSLIIADICQQVGITDCVFVHTDLEYPAFLKWCIENKPENCAVINTGQDIQWLAKHTKLIFPDNAAGIGRWFQIVQGAGITKYFKDNSLDVIVCGRRKSDGNYVGRGMNIYTNGKGVTRYSPIADWPHELALAYIHYNNISLPPIYEWDKGYFCGTHPWPSRMGMSSVEQGFSEVYKIDPNIIVEAAEYLPAARHFLEGVTK